MTDVLILCLVRDLLFYGKIRAAAESAGILLKCIRDPAKLAGETGNGLIVDLNQTGCLSAAAAWQDCTGKPVIGFVSHVDVETRQLASKSGIEQILARSQFEKNLPVILKSLST